MKGFIRFSLLVSVCFALAVVAGYGQTPYQISAPYTYKNLTIFLIHGKDATENKNLITLQEALELKVFKVYETEDVNELMVENTSPKFDVFIQSGDIVKGGKQDRVLAISIIVPKSSGKVSIEAFCVESGRWESRGSESVSVFSSSEERIVTKDLKIAANGQRSQQEVWNQVSNAQKNISANVNVDVTKNASGSSLQLALENKKVAAVTHEYVKKLRDLTKGKSDVIGYAFAINGKINSADIYVSNHLFTKLWPRMLKAAAVEAVSEAHNEKAAGEVNAGDINTFITAADKGKATDRATAAKSRVTTKETDKEAVYEARDKADVVVHRNYVKLN